MAWTINQGGHHAEIDRMLQTLTDSGQSGAPTDLPVDISSIGTHGERGGSGTTQGMETGTVARNIDGPNP